MLYSKGIVVVKDGGRWDASQSTRGHAPPHALHMGALLKSTWPCTRVVVYCKPAIYFMFYARGSIGNRSSHNSTTKKFANGSKFVPTVR